MRFCIGLRETEELRSELPQGSTRRRASQQTRRRERFAPRSGRWILALSGKGFFAVQSGQETVYTRNGSFNVDNEGYLVLQGLGRVQGQNGPIRVNTDDIRVTEQGYVLSADGRENYGRLQVVDFADYEQLEKTANGAFRSNAQPQGVNGTVIKQGYLEDSNVSMVQEMTNMMSGQRSLQSSAQLLKMYDQLSGKAIQLGSM